MSFAPRKLKEEVSIKAAIPAIQMEEVIPVAVSDKDRLAPQEIYKPQAEVIGESELTTEMLKARRRASKKKSKKQKHTQESEKKRKEKLRPGSQQSVTDALNQALMDRKTSIAIKTDTTDYGSSTEFFKRIQRDVEETKKEEQYQLDKEESQNKKKKPPASKKVKL